MSETSPDTGLDDDIGVQQAHDGRWAWVDRSYDGAGTRVVEWIEVVDLARSRVEVDGVEHLRFYDDTEDPETPGGSRWIQSSHWFDRDEMR